MANTGTKTKSRAKAKNKIGLDIGSSSIKIVEISTLEDTSSLVRIGSIAVPGTSHDALVGSIKALAEEAKVTTKEVAISVSGPSVIVRFLSMPKMKDEELKSAIKFEAEKYIPFAISDCVIDAKILRKDEKENKLDTILVAVKRELVMEKLSLVEDSGFTATVVDVDSFAILNAFLKNSPALDPNKTVALLNIGATFTNVCIARGGVPCFVRDVAIGGNDFNVAIAKGLSVDVKSVEGLKLSPKEKLQDIITCTRAVSTNLLDEMRLSFSYYENQCGRNIDEVCVSGGCMALPGLVELFQEAYGTKPCLWGPFQFLDKSEPGLNTGLLDTMKSSFALAVGLALR